MTHTTLDTLLKDNFENYQVLWNKRKFHSHTAHHLGSLALLGATDEQLKHIYENTMRHYTAKYEPSPHEITQENWHNSLGDTRFCSAYQEFFDKELPTQGDWKKKFWELLLDDTKGLPLINGALGGLFHPIIHISYAIELNSRLVACEALAMTAVCSGSMDKVPTELKPPTDGKKGALQVMKEVRSDDYIPKLDEPSQIDLVLSKKSILLSHYNQWQMPHDLDKAIEELFDMSVYIYAATHKPDQVDFDFALLHLLTAMDAIRKVRIHLGDNTVKNLLCHFFYLSVAFYIIQRQPKINQHLIDDYKMEENNHNWDYVVDRTLHTKVATEVHGVKVIRALKDAEKVYGSKQGLYLTAAIKTVDNLKLDEPWNYYKSHEPWIGMSDANRELNVKH